MLEAIVYIAFCVLTGLCGVHRRIGFLGTFILALILTPLVVLPVLFFTGPSRHVEWRPRDIDQPSLDADNSVEADKRIAR